MSQENVEITRRGYEHFLATGDFLDEVVAPDFVWDMSPTGGWPEQRIWEGIEGARAFIREWTGSWEDWELELVELRDAGERVVALLRQRGRSKQTGLPVDMTFAQVWSLRNGRQTRMDMYANPADALEAVGLRE